MGDPVSRSMIMEAVESTHDSFERPSHSRSGSGHSDEPSAHRFADEATRVVLFGMIVFSPWAFGGWPAWSVWCMNVGGYALWALLAVKCWVRRWHGYLPPRWGGSGASWQVWGLAILTACILVWCFVSAANARAAVDLETLQLKLKPTYISWLPHSFDEPQSWFAFWSCLGLAGVFWACRDWLSILSRRERVFCTDTRHGKSVHSEGLPRLTRNRIGMPQVPLVPERLKQLLRLLCLNGGLVAIVGILSVLDNPRKVMWLVSHETRVGSFFGPFWYRNNGAHFMNLLFPVCLGLWEVSLLRAGSLHQWLARVGKSPDALLLPCAALMISAPFIITSRGGSLVAAALIGCSILVVASTAHKGRWWKLVPALVLIGGLVFAFTLAWEPLKERFFRGFTRFETGLDGGSKDFTLRCVFEAPSVWKEKTVTVAGFSESRKYFYRTPRSVAVSLSQNGRLWVHYVGEKRGQVLSLSLTNRALAVARQRVELVLVQKSTTPHLYLNGEALPFIAVTNKTGFSWPSAFASAVLWVGRGAGGSLIYRDRIEAATLLDYALPPEQLAQIYRAAPARNAPPGITSDAAWKAMDPAPVLHVHPQSFSFKTWIAEGFGGRSKFFRDSRRMLDQYPGLFGAGPGTFGSLYKVHLQDATATDEWYVHDDHLETRLTFGWLGAGLVYVALALAVIPVGRRQGVRLPGILVAFLVLSLVGSLVHARLDWVFQTHAILFAAILLCSVLSTRAIGAKRV